MRRKVLIWIKESRRFSPSPAAAIRRLLSRCGQCGDQICRGGQQITVGAASRLADHRLDVVAVGIEHETGVVVFAIIRARAWRAIVFRAGLDCGAVECIDFEYVFYSEGDMQMDERRLLARRLDLEQAAIADIEGPEHALLAEGEAVSQRRKSPFVEELAPSEVAHFDGDVVDHDVLRIW